MIIIITQSVPYIRQVQTKAKGGIHSHTVVPRVFVEVLRKVGQDIGQDPRQVVRMFSCIQCLLAMRLSLQNLLLQV